MGFGPLNTHINGLLADALAKPKLAVKNDNGATILDHIDGLVWYLATFTDPGHIAGNADHSVAIMAAQIGAGEARCDGIGFLRIATGAVENLARQIDHAGSRNQHIALFVMSQTHCHSPLSAHFCCNLSHRCCIGAQVRTDGG